MQNLITQLLDIWTGAQTARTNGGRGRAKNGNGRTRYGIKKLRELILDLAVRGKLVPQDPDDEPASVLLEKIAKEKARLIKEGKIKKEKKLPGISEDEKPFELPDGWEWLKLGNFAYLEMGQSPPSEYYNQKMDGIPFFQGKADFGELHPTTRYWCTKPMKVSFPGDILLSVRAPVGPTNIGNIECCIGRGLAALRPLSNSSSKYLLTIMRAFQKRLEMLATGTTFSAVSKTNIESFLIPIPPLSEQHRIIAKVDELMTLCDQLERLQEDATSIHQTLVESILEPLTMATDHDEFIATWQRISNHFDTLFTTEQSIDLLKQTILQLAVMGRLVPQNPDDEPASVLLEKIAKGKARLIKEGKIKKEKKLPKITDDEKWFVLPNNWVWVRLGDFGRIISGNSFKSGDFNNEGGVKVIKITNAGVGEFIETEDYLPSNFLNEYESYTVNKNDIIIALTRPYISAGLKVSKCPGSYHNSLLNQRVAAIKLFGDENFIFLFLRSPFVLSLYTNRFGSSGLQPNLKVSDVSELIIPIPPLGEQHRIVAKVDELMALCDQLKSRINEAQTIQNQLADTIIEQAVV